ncbi:MAG: zf-HC2 domain-containing protein [Thermogutta sp.]
MNDSSSQKGPNVEIEAIRDELVAYLDGELSAEEAARIELLAEQDMRVREELQRLAETWDWLDALERPTVDEDFTRTTLEMVAQSAASEVVSQVDSQRKLRLLLAGIAVLGAIVAFLVGWRTASFFWQNPNQWLIEHYAVIENQDYYRHVESLDFLRMLRDHGLFRDEEEFLIQDDAQEVDERRLFRPSRPPSGFEQMPSALEGPGSPREEMVPATNTSGQQGELLPKAPREQQSQPGFGPSMASAGGATDAPAVNESFVTFTSPADIRKHIASLNEAEKIELRRKIERFQRLSEVEQARMQKIHEELMAAPDRDELISVLRRYCQWFKLLTPSQRGELEALRADQQISWIQHTRNEMVAAALNRTLFNFPPQRLRTLLQDSIKVPPEERLPPGDVAVLVRTLESLAAERGEDLLDRLNPGEKQELLRRLNRVTDPQQRKDLLAITWLQWQLDHPDEVAVLTPTELEALRKQFSPPTRSRLEALSEEEQLKRVAQWIRSYVFFRYVMPRVWADMRRAVSEQELGRFVEENLTREEREALLQLPPDEMQRELTHRYLRWRYPGFEAMGPWRGRGGDRRGPRPGHDDREPPPGRPTEETNLKRTPPPESASAAPASGTPSSRMPLSLPPVESS